PGREDRPRQRSGRPANPGFFRSAVHSSTRCGAQVCPSEQLEPALLWLGSEQPQRSVSGPIDRAFRGEAQRSGDPRGCHPANSACRRRARVRSEEHTSELQSRENLVCRLLLEKKKQK